MMSVLLGWYGSDGRRAGSRSCCKVCSVPGAVGLAVRACRAAGSSPRCIKWRVLCTRRSKSGSVMSGCGVSGDDAVAW